MPWVPWAMRVRDYRNVAHQHHTHRCLCDVTKTSPSKMPTTMWLTVDTRAIFVFSFFFFSSFLLSLPVNLCNAILPSSMHKFPCACRKSWLRFDSPSYVYKQSNDIRCTNSDEMLWQKNEMEFCTLKNECHYLSVTKKETNYSKSNSSSNVPHSNSNTILFLSKHNQFGWLNKAFHCFVNV